MGIKSNCNIYGDKYSINGLKFNTVTTIDVMPFTFTSYPVNNMLSAEIYRRYANHHEHPLYLENIWQDHQRLQLQEQVNIWNRMMYRFWKLQQQQYLIPYYRNAWYMSFNPSYMFASILKSSEELLNIKKPRKKNVPFTKEQIRILENSFQNNMYLSYMNKRYLAYQLGVTERRVAIWFQNRRFKKFYCIRIDHWLLNFRRLLAERMKMLPSNVMRS